MEKSGKSFHSPLLNVAVICSVLAEESEINLKLNVYKNIKYHLIIYHNSPAPTTDTVQIMHLLISFSHFTYDFDRPPPLRLREL